MIVDELDKNALFGEEKELRQAIGRLLHTHPNRSGQFIANTRVLWSAAGDAMDDAWSAKANAQGSALEWVACRRVESSFGWGRIFENTKPFDSRESSAELAS